jgi:hypothetical protein
MSSSGSDMMQEKEADTPVVWNDLEGMCTHLEGVLERSAHEGVNAHQALQLQVQGTAENVSTMQAQFTSFQQSNDQLTQSLAACISPLHHHLYNLLMSLLMMTVSMTMPIC